MSGWRGIFAGALSLIVLEAVLSSRQAANRTAGLFGDVASIITRALDPNLPAIPDLVGAFGAAATAPAVAHLPDPPANGKPKPRKPVVAPPPVTTGVI